MLSCPYSSPRCQDEHQAIGANPMYPVNARQANHGKAQAVCKFRKKHKQSRFITQTGKDFTVSSARNTTTCSTSDTAPPTPYAFSICSRAYVCIQRPGLPLACHSSWLASVPAATELLFKHVFPHTIRIKHMVPAISQREG